MRERPFSFAASLKLRNERSFGFASVHVWPAGSVMLQLLKRIRSVPKTRGRAITAGISWPFEIGK